MFKSILAIFLSIVLFASCGSDDNEPKVLPQVLASDTSFVEGNIRNTKKLLVTLSAATTDTVIVDYQTANGTAIAGSDYIALQNRRLVFLPMELSKSIDIEILGDQAIEEDKYFYMDFPFAQNAQIKTSQVKITILNDDFDNSNAGKLVIPSTGFVSPEAYSGMALVWRDEFDGTILNPQYWTHEIGDGCPGLCGWGNAELQYYKSENSTLLNGNLIIEAKKENVGNRQYSSSRIISKNKQSFKYGRIDIRAALPYGQGVWPALWMLGTNIDQVGWPACGEIDIMEMIGGGAGRDNTVHGTLHWSNNGSHAYFGKSYTLPSGKFADQYHVFSIIWEERSIKWLVDGVEFHSMDISPSQMDEFRNNFFLIMNIAVGGTWPGNPTISTVFPQYMIIDYIRVFQKQ